MTASLPFKSEHGGIVGIVSISEIGVTIAVPFAVMSLEAAQSNLENALGAVRAALAVHAAEAARVAKEKAAILAAAMMGQVR